MSVLKIWKIKRIINWNSATVNILMQICPDVQRMPWHITNSVKHAILSTLATVLRTTDPSHREAT